MAAMLFIVQICFAGLPNIELVSFLIIIFTINFSAKQVFFASYIFCVLEGLFYGFGLWWIMYLYVWQILILITSILKKIDSIIVWAVISGSFGLFFGALCSIPYLFIGGIGMAFAWWVSGLPFDILHCIGNFTVMLILYKPIRMFFTKIKKII